MVVTPRTSDRQAQKRLADDVDLVVESSARDFSESVALLRTSLNQNCVVPNGRLPRGSIGAETLRRNLVARDVLAYELVVRNVFIERANDIVAIAPWRELVVIVFVSVRLGIADKVLPVPRPALAVVR